jgi:YbbR domain-containing protein
VRIGEILPSKIIIKLEAVIEKEVPVQAEKGGSLPDGLVVYGETVAPQKVRVRGPASYIKTLEFVSTEKIDLGNKTADFTARQVAVTVSNPKARIVDAALVDVAFRIGEKRGERLVTAAIKGDTTGKKIPVNIYGPLSLLKGIKPGDLKVEMVDDEAGRKVPQLVDLPAELQGKIEILKAK